MLWFKLLRPFNLVLIALTVPALWVVLVVPLLGQTILNYEQAITLGITLALVAGGGNVVNDICDRTIDELNDSPNPLNQGLPTSLAWLLYGVLNLAAALLTWQLAADLDMIRYAILFPVVALLLLAYAHSLKCMPLIGNVLVAGLCAGVPAILLLAEPLILETVSESPLSQSLISYIVFAFFGSLARELVKDIEDVRGDRAAGCHTLAARWSLKNMLWLIIICLFVTMSAVAYVIGVWYITGTMMQVVSWSGLWLLLAAITFTLSPKLSLEEAGQLSTHLKIAIGFGLVLLILIGVNT